MKKGYFYKGETWCETCGESAREECDGRGATPANRDDDATYHSDDYPKGPYDNGGLEFPANAPAYCAGCGEFLENELTPKGRADAIRIIREDCDDNTAQELMDFYGIDEEEARGSDEPERIAETFINGNISDACNAIKNAGDPIKAAVLALRTARLLDASESESFAESFLDALARRQDG